MTLQQRLDAVIDAALGSRIVGCVVLVNENGKRVYARAAGLADRETGRAVREDDVFRLASVTKPIVATAALVMADRGLLSLDDTVTKYLPWFAPKSPDGVVRDILIRHLLTHTSGLTYDVPDDVSRGAVGPLIPLEENLRRLARQDLAFAPGTAWHYGMNIDVLGGVLAAINGTDLEGVLARHVMGPLGMTETHFVVTDRSRVPTAYADGPAIPVRMSEPHAWPDATIENPEYFSPVRIFQPEAPQSGGSGLAGTAGDFSKMLEALLHGDLLKPETRAAAFSNQIGELPRDDAGQRFGFLGAVIADPAASGWPVAGMMHWGGIWGNNWMLDPASKRSVVVYTNTMGEGCNGPFREEVRDAVFA
jgi:CubicO group peptidase (beta-lactamase class C family)